VRRIEFRRDFERKLNVQGGERYFYRFARRRLREAENTGFITTKFAAIDAGFPADGTGAERYWIVATPVAVLLERESSSPKHIHWLRENEFHANYAWNKTS
jgi:hypothetical protein